MLPFSRRTHRDSTDISGGTTADINQTDLTQKRTTGLNEIPQQIQNRGVGGLSPTWSRRMRNLKYGCEREPEDMERSIS